jgi:hypothetical protein
MKVKRTGKEKSSNLHNDLYNFLDRAESPLTSKVNPEISLESALFCIFGNGEALGAFNKGGIILFAASIGGARIISFPRKWWAAGSNCFRMYLFPTFFGNNCDSY